MFIGLTCPVMVTTSHKDDHIRALLYFYSTSIEGIYRTRGVCLKYTLEFFGLRNQVLGSTIVENEMDMKVLHDVETSICGGLGLVLTSHKPLQKGGFGLRDLVTQNFGLMV